jgi:hypothetical protein
MTGDRGFGEAKVEDELNRRLSRPFRRQGFKEESA